MKLLVLDTIVGPLIIAEDDAGIPLGRLQLDKRGRVAFIGVGKEFRRKGVATAMWFEAIRRGFKPVHSATRTDAGDAWAKTVGGALPPRGVQYGAAYDTIETLTR